MTEPQAIIDEAAELARANPGMTVEAALLALLIAELRKLTTPAGARKQ